MSEEEKYLKEIEKNIEIFEDLMNKCLSKERLKSFKKIIEKYGQQYFTAPASSKKEYHYAFPGGLLKHSINVFNNLLLLNKTFGTNFEKESMFIAAFMHDLGKAAESNGEDHYVKAEKWRREKRGQMYTFNDDCTYMSNHLRSIFLLQDVGFKLSDEEFMAIYLNDGMYIQENRTYGLKEPKLALLLHFADRWSLEMERED